MYERTEIHTLTKRIKEPRRFIQVIVGPRQVGKTTLVQQFYNKKILPAIYVNADDMQAAAPNWIEQQ